MLENSIYYVKKGETKRDWHFKHLLFKKYVQFKICILRIIFKYWTDQSSEPALYIKWFWTTTKIIFSEQSKHLIFSGHLNLGKNTCWSKAITKMLKMRT